MAFKKAKKQNLFEETDKQLSGKFSQAGFGFSSGISVLFSPLEAAYLVKTGKSKFSGKTLEQFMASQEKTGKNFPFALAVYSLIYKKARQIRPFMKSAKYFRVYAPGIGRLEGKPSQFLCLAPGEAPSLKALEQEIKKAHLARLELIIAYGTEKEPKFIKVSSFNF